GLPWTDNRHFAVVSRHQSRIVCTAENQLRFRKFLPYYASIILLRIAYLTNSLTEWQSSLLMMFARCVSAVFTLSPSATATSLLLLPSASSCTISRCLGVSRVAGRSVSADARGFLSRYPSSTICATREVKYVLFR